MTSSSKKLTEDAFIGALWTAEVQYITANN